MRPLKQGEQEALTVVAALVAANIGKRLRERLEEHGHKDALEMGAYAAIVAIPVIQTFLFEEDPFQAMDEVDELERLLKEGE